MQLGHHFGKRKPSWNVFHEQTRMYFQSLENTILKSSVLLSTVQFLILAPLLYWTIENYSLFIELIPAKTHLKENLIAEKKWISFLFSITYLVSIIFNYQILKMISQKTEKNFHSSSSASDQEFNDQTFSFDEAAVRRRAS